MLVQPGLVLVVVGLVAHRIPAGIFVEIDVAVLPPSLPDRRSTTGGGASSVVRMKSSLEQLSRCTIAWKRGTLRATSSRGVMPSLRRRLLHLDAVLVGAGEEEDVVAVEPHEARDRVGRDRLVGVADMRRAVRIGDRRGDVVARLAGGAGGRLARRSGTRAGRRSGFRSRGLRRGSLWSSRLESGWLLNRRLHRSLDRLRRQRLGGSRLGAGAGTVAELSAGAADVVFRFVVGLAVFAAVFATLGRTVAAVLAAGFFFEVAVGSALLGRGRAAAFFAFFGAGSAFPPFPALVPALFGLRFRFFCHGARQQSVRNNGQIRRWPGQARP